MAQHLRRKFGSGIQVRYVDMARNQGAEASPAVMNEIREKKLFLPVVAINGEVAFKGYVDYWSIVEYIEKLRADGLSTLA